MTSIALPRSILVAVALGFAASAATALAAEEKIDCEPKGNARPICIFTNPEDMVPLPGNQAILIGEYAHSGAGHSGGLAIFKLASEERQTLFRGGDSSAVAEAGWGDPSCTSPPTSAFNSHGIDLVTRNDGRLELLVVQHGGREAIEFFELEGQGTDWKITWRGCVPAPPDASLNEVVALPNGDFYTTKMAQLEGALDFENGLPTEPTGHAFAWSASKGYRAIVGTAGIMPNGIAASPDGRILYMNVSGENSIRKIEVATGKELGRAEVSAPDNVTWSPDGRLLVASAFVGEIDPAVFAACMAKQHGYCEIPFKIVAVDPATMTTLGTIYESDGTPLGAGTVGLQVGRELFIGSFKSDRILRVALDEK